MLRKLLGLNLNFIPTPLPDRNFIQNWNENIKQLKRQVKLALFFQNVKATQFNKRLHVKNTKWQPPAVLPVHLQDTFKSLELETLPFTNKKIKFNACAIVSKYFAV